MLTPGRAPPAAPGPAPCQDPGPAAVLRPIPVLPPVNGNVLPAGSAMEHLLITTWHRLPVTRQSWPLQHGTLAMTGAVLRPSRRGSPAGDTRTVRRIGTLEARWYPMSTPHPHSVADLVLAPVLIGIERNLGQLRDSQDPEFDMALALDDDGGWYRCADERAKRVQRIATRGVDQHGWQVTPTADHQGLAVQHGRYRVSVMLGGRLAGYVERGTFAAPAPLAGSGR